MSSLSSSFSNLACFSCIIPQQRGLFNKLSLDKKFRDDYELKFKTAVGVSIGRQPQDVAIVKTFKNPQDESQVTLNFVINDLHRDDRDGIAEAMYQAKESLS